MFDSNGSGGLENWELQNLLFLLDPENLHAAEWDCMTEQLHIDWPPRQSTNEANVKMSDFMALMHSIAQKDPNWMDQLERAANHVRTQAEVRAAQTMTAGGSLQQLEGLCQSVFESFDRDSSGFLDNSEVDMLVAGLAGLKEQTISNTLAGKQGELVSAAEFEIRVKQLADSEAEDPYGFLQTLMDMSDSGSMASIPSDADSQSLFYSAARPDAAIAEEAETSAADPEASAADAEAAGAEEDIAAVPVVSEPENNNPVEGANQVADHEQEHEQVTKSCVAPEERARCKTQQETTTTTHGDGTHPSCDDESTSGSQWYVGLGAGAACLTIGMIAYMRYKK